MQSLFPQSQQSAAALIEFKAGKCTISPTLNCNGKHQVTPDTEKRGKISLVKQDGLLNFKWTNAVNGVIEDTRIILPGENVFKRVNTGKESDRVYVLKSNASDQHLMFWLQDKSTDRDEYNTKRVSELMVNPNAPTEAVSGGNAMPPDEWMNAMGLPDRAGATGTNSGSGDSSNRGNSSNAAIDFASLLGTVSGAGAATNNLPAPPGPNVTAPPAASAASTGRLTMADFQRAMQQSAPPATPSLQDILTPDEITSSGILDDPSIHSELIQHLPTEQQNAGQLESTVRSPQFQQSLGTLSHALAQSDNYQAIMSNFGINTEARMQEQMSGDGVGAFLASFSAANPTEEQEAEKKEEEKKEDNNGMDEG